MKHHVYEHSDSYPIALLVKNTAFDVREIENTYLNSILDAGMNRGDVILISLNYVNNKASVKMIKEELAQILPALESVGTRYIYCADANYFKVLVGQRKAEPHLGYVFEEKLSESAMKVVLGINHKSLLYNDANQDKLLFSLRTLKNMLQGKSQMFSESPLKNAYYPASVSAIEKSLNDLLDKPFLAVDIETASLRHDRAGIGTIGFAWNHHDGIAFAVDYSPSTEPVDGIVLDMKPNLPVRSLLKKFFTQYQGAMRFHGSTFDIKILIYVLWMENLLDTRGLLVGLEIMTRRFHDTKVIAYLAKNTTAQLSLSLKSLAHEHAGNYAQEEIKNTRRIPLPQLLEYNLIDCCCTNFVYDRYCPIMLDENQLDIYHNLMLPSQKVIIQTELTGMPLNPKKVLEAEKQLQTLVGNALQTINTEKATAVALHKIVLAKQAKDLTDRRAKAKAPEKLSEKPPEHWKDYLFNVNSTSHLQVLLYDVMHLPVLDKTTKGQPATGGDTLEKLINHTTNEDYKRILEAIVAYAKAQIILTTFIPSFKEAIDKHDGVVWLHGSFNLGGTVSGRLSSSDPNLQNIPSGSTYGKLIKSCFQAPAGWVFTGADFNALESVTNALITKDPNKLKVFTDGYDSHSYHAYAYWEDQVPKIRQALSYAEKGGKFYKVTYDDNTTEYLSEFDPRFKVLTHENRGNI